MNVDKYFFRIKKSELGKYSTTGITLDEDLLSKYTPATIERAKELKAKNKDSKQKFSDEYYLNYAKSLQLQDIRGALNEIHHKRLANLEITDKDWAGYSYDEIIEMENQGVEIPDEVLLWAHAQQESDVTDYIIVSDSTTTDDSESTNAIDGSDELQNLQKKARENINKAEEANQTAETKAAEFKKTTRNAKKIKVFKEKNYKNAMEKMESMAKEWKELDDKKKNGKLNFAERIKYASLSKKLNGKNDEGGTKTKALEADNAVLDEFLTSLDELKNDVNDNLELAQNTTQSGRDLSEFEKNYQTEDLPQVMTGIRNNGMSFDSDELYGANTENIADLAIETGNELNLTTNEISGNIESDKNLELAEFAQNYTTLAKETLDNTQNIINGNENDDSQDEQDQDKEQKAQSKLKSYSVDMEFTDKNSKKAIETTIAATTNLYSNQDSVTKEEKSLQKELAQNAKDIKNLEKESKIAKEKQQANLIKEESLIAELEAMEANNIQNSGADETPKTVQNTVQTETSENEIQPTIDEIKTIDDENKNTKTDVNKALTQGIKSDTKSQKVSKTLTAQNSDLATRTANAQQVATDTTIVGVGTFTKSFITTAIGQAMFATGTSLLPNPFTYSAGLALTIAGTELQKQGASEFTYGLAASATGAIGYAATLGAGETHSNTKNSLKISQGAFKANKQVFEETNKNNSEDNSVQNPDENTTQNSKNNEQLPVSLEETNNIETDTEVEPTNSQETQNTQEQIQETTTDQQNINNQDSDTQPAENNENSNDKKDSKQEKEYSVSMEFTAPNATKAAQTTQQATSDLLSATTKAEGLNSTVNTQLKSSKNILKNIQKEADQAQAQNQANIQIKNSIQERFITSENQMNSATTQDEAIAAQGEMITLADEFEAANNQDEQTSTSANKVITNNSAQLNNFKTNSQNLNEELSDLNKKINTQLKVSNDTISVGIGTTVFGAYDTVMGAASILSGTALMSNPFTFSAGLMQTIQGEILVTKGTLEIATGGNAIVEGNDGIKANQIAKNASTDSENTVKTTQKEYKQADKDIQEAKKALNIEDNNTEELTLSDPQSITEEETEEIQTEVIIANNEDSQEEESSTIAASATANANITNKTTTDDKADRKLSRFNMDSIIESKKKAKKVQAVSASAKNGK